MPSNTTKIEEEWFSPREKLRKLGTGQKKSPPQTTLNRIDGGKGKERKRKNHQPKEGMERQLSHTHRTTGRERGGDRTGGTSRREVAFV